MENVDKVIDGIAIAIKADLAVDKLQDLELCYAPPYSSAKNPINFIGYVAENLLTDKVKTIQWHEVDELIKKGECVVDVSEEQEFMMGNISGSINVPLSVLRENLDKLSEKVYVYCRVGLRGYIASRILRQRGKEVYNLDGGYAPMLWLALQIKILRVKCRKPMKSLQRKRQEKSRSPSFEKL